MDLQNIPNYTINVCLLGDSGIGKSSLTTRLDTNKFDYNLATTIGVDFLAKIFTAHTTRGDINIKWHIYDTAGQETFRSLVKTYYRNATIYLLGFDLTCPESFKSLEFWLGQIYANNQNYFKIYLFGNKNDKHQNIRVTDNYVADIIEKYNLTYFKISVLKNTNITNMVKVINQDIGEYLIDVNVSEVEKKLKNIKIHSNKKINLSEINYNNKCC